MDLRLLLLLCGLVAAPLLPAAEPDFTNAAEAKTADTGSEADGAPGQDAGAAPADAGTANDEDAAPATRAAGEDFVPSVQISEDLSVSFPTDI